MQEQKNDDRSSNGTTKVTLGVIGTVLLSVLSSGLWEILFRPGLGRVGNFITSVSAKAEQSIYTTAALDPTPVPSLLLLLFFVLIPALMALWFVHRGYVQPFLEKRVRRKIHRYETEAENSPNGPDIVEKKIQKNIKWIAAFGAIYSLVFFAILFLRIYH